MKYPDSYSSLFSDFMSIIGQEKKDLYKLYFLAAFSGFLSIFMPLGVQALVNFLVFNVISTAVITLIVLVVIAMFFDGLVHIVSLQLVEKIEQKIFVRYALQLGHILPTIDLRKVNSAYLSQVVNYFLDTSSMQKGIKKLFSDIPKSTIQIVFSILLLLFYHPIFIFFTFLVIGMVYIIFRLVSVRGLETSLQESKYKYRTLSFLQEIALNIRVFKNFYYTGYNDRKADVIVEEYLHYRTEHFFILRKQHWNLLIFKIILILLMFVFGLVLIQQGSLNVGQFIAAEIILSRIIASLEKIVFSVDAIFQVLTAKYKLEHLLELPRENIYKQETELIDTGKGMEIQMKKVDFWYTENEEVLENLSISIPTNHKVIFTSNQSGEGLSSSLKILNRFYPIKKGQLLINRIPIEQYNLLEYRSKISSQIGNPEILQATILENILLGRKHLNLQKVMELAEELGFVDLLHHFPKGYFTPISNQDLHLAGHLINKIVLLRSLIEPKLLLLIDEPFDHLSQIEKENVLRYIAKLNTTVIITMKDCTQIPSGFHQIINISKSPQSA